MAKTTESPTGSVYTAEQICASERFRAERDVLVSLLRSGQAYALQEVEKLLRDFKQSKIKEQINGGEL